MIETISKDKMFEISTRRKYRYETYKGNISTEDLWDMPLSRTIRDTHKPIDVIACLDDIAINLTKLLENISQKSFVAKKNKSSKIIELKLEIVKHIIKVKLDEIEEKETAAIIKTKNDLIDRIIIKKQNKELEDMSIEELQKEKK